MGCENCKHALVQHGRVEYQVGNVHVVQNGKDNITCIYTGSKNVSITDDGMLCSAFSKGWDE